MLDLRTYVPLDTESSSCFTLAGDARSPKLIQLSIHGDCVLVRFRLIHLFILMYFLGSVGWYLNTGSDLALYISSVVGSLLGIRKRWSAHFRRVVYGGVGGALAAAVHAPSAIVWALHYENYSWWAYSVWEQVYISLLSIAVLAGLGGGIGIALAVLCWPLNFLVGLYMNVVDRINYPMSRDKPKGKE